MQFPAKNHQSQLDSPDSPVLSCAHKAEDGSAATQTQKQNLHGHTDMKAELRGTQTQNQNCVAHRHGGDMRKSGRGLRGFQGDCYFSYI